MSRRTEKDYMKIPRETLRDTANLSRNAILLFLWLNELEQRYTEENGARDWFMQTNAELVEKTGLCLDSVKDAKRELKEKGFIEVFRGGWHYVSTGKSSIKQPCCFRILK